MHQAIEKRSIHPQNNFTGLQGHLSKIGYSEKEINLSFVEIRGKGWKTQLNKIEEKPNSNIQMSWFHHETP